LIISFPFLSKDGLMCQSIKYTTKDDNKASQIMGNQGKRVKHFLLKEK